MACDELNRIRDLPICRPGKVIRAESHKIPSANKPIDWTARTLYSVQKKRERERESKTAVVKFVIQLPNASVTRYARYETISPTRRHRSLFSFIKSNQIKCKLDSNNNSEIENSGRVNYLNVSTLNWGLTLCCFSADFLGEF